MSNEDISQVIGGSQYYCKKNIEEPEREGQFYAKYDKKNHYCRKHTKLTQIITLLIKKIYVMIVLITDLKNYGILKSPRGCGPPVLK